MVQKYFLVLLRGQGVQVNELEFQAVIHIGVELMVVTVPSYNGIYLPILDARVRIYFKLVMHFYHQLENRQF